MTTRAYEGPDGDGYTGGRSVARGTTHIKAESVGLLDADEKPSVLLKSLRKAPPAFEPIVLPVVTVHSEDIKFPDGTAYHTGRKGGVADRAIIDALVSNFDWTLFASGYDIDKMRITNPELLETLSNESYRVLAGSMPYAVSHPQLRNELLSEQFRHGAEALLRAGLGKRRSPVGKHSRFAYNDFAFPESGGLASMQVHGIDYLLFADRVSQHNLHPTLNPGTGSCFWLTDGNTSMRAINFDPLTRDRFKWAMRGENGYTPEQFVKETIEDVQRAGRRHPLTVLYMRFEDVHAAGPAGVSRFNELVSRLSDALSREGIASGSLSKKVLDNYEPLWDESAVTPVPLQEYAWEQTPTQRSLVKAIEAVSYQALKPQEQRRLLTATDELFSDAAYNLDQSADEVDAQTRHLSLRVLEEGRRLLVDFPHRPNVFTAGSFSTELDSRDEAIMRVRKNVRYQATD